MSYRFATASLSLFLLAGCGDAPAPADDAAPAAQETNRSGALQPVGNIAASFGSENRTWTALYRDDGERAAATSTYQVRTIGRREVHLLSLGGNVDVSMSSRRSLRVRVDATSPLVDCPCEATGALEYIDEDGKLIDGASASITVDRFQENGDGTYGAEGRFSGALPAASEGGQPVQVEGTFDIDKIMRVGPGA